MQNRNQRKGFGPESASLLAIAWRLSPSRFIWLCVSSIVTSLVGGASLLLLVPVVNSVFSSTVQVDVPVLGGIALSAFPLWILLAGFVVLTGLSAFSSWATTVETARFQQLVVDRLRQTTFEAILQAKWSFVLGAQKSDIIHVVTTGAQQSGVAFQQLITSLVALVVVIGVAVVTVVITPVLGVLTIVGLLVAASLRSVAIKKSYGLGLLTAQRNKVVQSVVTNSLDSLRLIKAHDASQTWAKKLSDAFGDVRSAQFSHIKHNAGLAAGWTIGTAAAASAIILFSVWMGVPATALVLFLVIVARLSGQLRGLVNSLGILAFSLPSVRQLAELRRSADEALEINLAVASQRTELQVAVGTPLLTFDNVSYSYVPAGRGVSAISFEIMAGHITALSGPSGSGKSTLADLALGLLTPETGTVCVAGTPLAEADLPWWRSHVAYVPQQTHLIPGSLRENLIWPIPGEVSDEQCWEALRQAEAQFAFDLESGLDTPLGDSGQHLSGGERQRISLARALLRNPVLLVLDEATSALDQHTESAVMDMARSLLPNITVLLISHRESTLDDVDHIVKLTPLHAADFKAPH